MIAKTADEKDLKKFNIDNHPGYLGVFTRDQAAGAIPNGSKIVKTKSDGTDSNPDGTPGKVLGSFHPTGVPYPMYFVEWDRKPHIAVAISGPRIKEAS